MAERAVMKAVRRAKLFVFLRLHRHELFDEEFQAELARAYADKPKGQPPVTPAQLALATILQAYTGVSDDEVVEAAGSWTGAGSWCWPAWMRNTRRFPRAPWWGSAPG
jgi:hypothetical protein